PVLSHHYVHHRSCPTVPTRRSSDLLRRRRLVDGADDLALGRKRSMAERVQTRDLGVPLAVQLLGPRAIAAVDRPAVEQLRQPLEDRKSTRLNSSHQIISYAVFCLKQ